MIIAAKLFKAADNADCVKSLFQKAGVKLFFCPVDA